MIKRKALGKGIKALISHLEEDADSEVRELPISQIEPNPFQPRKDFSDDELNELCNSIREKGILQPLIVRRREEKYQLVVGERRWRAAQKAGLKDVPVIIKDMVGDSDMLEIGLVENMQRSDLNEMEKARAFQLLAERFEYTHEQIAERLGFSRSSVTNSLRLLKLSPKVQQLLESKRLTMGHARALLMIESHDEQESLSREVCKNGTSVRELESILSKELKRSVKRQKRQLLNPHLEKLIEDLRYALGTKVDILTAKAGGKIYIRYYNNDDLERICAVIKGKGYA